MINDLCVGIAFLTRLPMPHSSIGPNFARAHRFFPLIGAAIGGVIGLVYLGLVKIGVPPLGAAAVALGAGALLTGGLHEDGLSDMADGFGGGRNKPAKLEIMHDSRLGTFGALALIVAFTTKLSALAALPHGTVVPALMVTHAIARTPMTVMAMVLPNARADGLSASAGRPSVAATATAVIVALSIAVLALPWPEALGSALAAASAGLAVGVIARRQIGGQTGDVLGATEQVAETAVLLFLAAMHH